MNICMVFMLSAFIHQSKCNPLYFIYQEAWPVSLVWKCSGTPNLKAQRVNFIEESSKIYYDTLMSGRFIEDRNLDFTVPPNSILKSQTYLDLLDLVMYANTEQLGNLIVMRISCELMNNLTWIKEIFNRPLSRNTETLRAILDIIYRLGLCFRDIDPHLNCPDVCRSKTSAFCEDIPHAVGFCGTYMDELLRSTQMNHTGNREELKKNLRSWLLRVPVERRLPLDFFLHFIENKNFFDKAVEIQLRSSLIAYCPCEAKYIYDKLSNTCLDIKEEYGCYSSSQCSNGGMCVQSLKKYKSPSDSVCKCPPAFKGDQCEHERNPCEDEADCDPFPCVRDANDLDYGYRCLCPATHQRKSYGQPQCVPLPACGEYNTNRRQLCKNHGQCLQDPNDPTMYKCICKYGYSGVHCETEPLPAVWSIWSAWSDCVWPEVGEVCHRKAYRQQTRTCLINAFDQKCIGEAKKIRYSGCDLTELASKSHTNLSQIGRKRLMDAFKLCGLYGREYVTPITEYELGEPLLTIEALDDWSTIGLEEAPYLYLPESLKLGQLQSENWPQRQDFLFITGWIYLFILHLGIVLLWIYYIHHWRTRELVDE
ncbi:unnamed protein product [Heterobilharzia americana]|nr:unnamed protein product [Heterobilharzia americana]CAH8517068.1 unnamed protein product [Heterobilharzia americana]